MGVRGELDLFREDVNRRLGHLEEWADDHDDEHNAGLRERQWTPTKVVAVLAGAATVGGFWLNAVGK